LWPFEESNDDGQALSASLRQALTQLGWPDLRIDSRWGGGNVERTRAMRRNWWVCRPR
jgi:hypothetical protein